ncbi:MAG: OB-fold domain-containing protein [Burkholderiaceae bacterium]
MTRQIRVPEPEGLNAELYRQWQDGVLRIQRCSHCARWQHPPRFVCAQCGGEDFAWSPSTMRGQLFSWVVTHHPFDRGWADEAPWITAVMELESGVRLVGHLAGVPREELRLGMPLTVTIEPFNDSFAFLTFHAREDTR